MQRWLWRGVLCALVVAVLWACSGKSENKSEETGMNRPDINDVLRAHSDRIMAISGVAGLYVGVLDDEVTPCIKIMVVEKTAALEKALPKSLDGYPVVIVETGEIKPLQQRQSP